MVTINTIEQTERVISAFRYEIMGMSADEVLDFTAKIQKEIEYWRTVAIIIIAKR